MPKRFWMTSFAGIAASVLAGCSADPGGKCADPDTQKRVISLLLDNVQARLGSGTGNLATGFSLSAERKRLEDQNFYNIDQVTFLNFDRATGRITCEAFVSYHPPDEDRPLLTGTGNERLEAAWPEPPPAGLADGTAQPSRVAFDIRKDLQSGSGIIVLGAGADTAISAGAHILVSRWGAQTTRQSASVYTGSAATAETPVSNAAAADSAASAAGAAAAEAASAAGE